MKIMYANQIVKWSVNDWKKTKINITQSIR